MALGPRIPGTTYRLAEGSVLSPDGQLYISRSGCVYQKVPFGATRRLLEPTNGIQTWREVAIGDVLSVPTVRQDGVASTYTLPGSWQNASGVVPECYAKVTPKSHFERFFGALTAAPGLVNSSLASTIGEVRAMWAKELPGLKPFLALADAVASRAASAAGVDLKTLTGAWLAGAQEAGLPVDTVQQVLASPESALRDAAARAAQQFGIDPALLGFGTPAPTVQVRQNNQPGRQLAPGVKRSVFGFCYDADNNVVDCETGALRYQNPGEQPPASSSWSTGEIVLLVLAGLVVAAIIVAVVKD